MFITIAEKVLAVLGTKRIRELFRKTLAVHLYAKMNLCIRGSFLNLIGDRPLSVALVNSKRYH